MSSNPEAAQCGESGKYGLEKLALLSLLTGAGIGLVIGGFFRVALEHMNIARSATIVWIDQWPVISFVLVCATIAVTTALAHPGQRSVPGNLRPVAAYPMSRR